LLDALSPISQHITKVINTEDNIGFARGNNIGIRQARKDGAEYILLLNDDTEVAPDFLTILINAAEASPDAGILGPKIFRFGEPDRVWFAGAQFNHDTCEATTEYEQTDQSEDAIVVESDYISGCALLIKMDTIEKIGMLDERFFLYWEDVDWGLRCSKAGLKNLVVPTSHIWHKISVTSDGIDSLIRAYHKTRSHLLIARLCVPKVLWKLQRKFFRDIAWLLFKSSDPDSAKKSLAFFVAMVDYHLGKTGKGPDWLWVK
jgi:GT2 family glycosyltransferase